VIYEPVLGSAIQFDTGGTGADLAVYRIIGHPNAPEVLFSQSPPIEDVEDVTLIGKGWTREATETTWTSSWTETPPGATAFTGYKRLSSGVMRWGRNRVTISDVELTLGGRKTRSFYTAFDAQGGLSDEALAVTGDSGGAAFVKRDGTWELAGIMYARTEFVDQLSDTAVFGNETILVDISFYRDQILEVITPDIPLLPPHALGILTAVILAIGYGTLGRRATAR
jgi:hypothetical protein